MSIQQHDKSDYRNENIEQTMRRYEIERLWKREMDVREAELMGWVSQRFMNRFIYTADCRFLNTALKLNDRLRRDFKETQYIRVLEEKEWDCFQMLARRAGLEP